MIGRFLEISVHAPDILDSIAFWERLGFLQVPTNDIWNHPYAVMSDGRLLLGLHAYRFDHSPALTFVRQNLASHLPAIAALGVEFEFAKTGEDQFHEAGFLSPDKQMVTLLESRTFSPPAFDGDDFSVLGRLDAMLLPVRHMEEALPFWARLGMVVIEFDEDHPDTALLTNGALSLRLSEDRALRGPVLNYQKTDLDAVSRAVEILEDKPGILTLRSPEGLVLSIAP